MLEHSSRTPLDPELQLTLLHKLTSSVEAQEWVVDEVGEQMDWGPPTPANSPSLWSKRQLESPETCFFLRMVMKQSFSICCDMQALLLFALGPSYSLILLCCMQVHVSDFDFYKVELIHKYDWLKLKVLWHFCWFQIYITSIYYQFVFFTLQAVTF